MMNEQELNALVGILQRCPVSPAEALWVESILQRMADRIKAQQEAKGDDGDSGIPR